jgi:hypothetical protein
MATALPTPSSTKRAIADRGEGGDTGHRPVKLRLAWIPASDLGHPGWVQAGQQLGAMSRVSNWWVGDWLRYGAARWGERYVEAARITGFDVKTLRNIAYVSRRFDLSRRRDQLHWSHHAEVAGLERQQQDRWLDRAIADRLSVSDLRIELRGAYRSCRLTAAEESEPCKSEDQAPTIICPHCGRTVSLEVPDKAEARR